MSDDYQELLKWLHQGTRTFGWGALVAWDRKRINELLLQDYIVNFTGGSYLPAFTDTIITSDVTAELIYDYTLDCPRLSFENATITDSKARLRMKVVGGSQLSVEQHQDGSPRLAKVSSIDVLNGPVLHMNLAINRMPGEFSAGKVVLNIAEGGDFEMGFADTVEQRRLGGDFFRKKFEALDDEQKIFVLGEVDIPEGDLLQPVDFRIRTHGKAGDPGAGAVLFLVRMEGDDNGQDPPSDADLRYLLAGAYSFTMLVARDVIMKKLFVPACKLIAHGSTPFVERIESPPEGATHYLHAASGASQLLSVHKSTASFSSVWVENVRLPMASASSVFRLIFESTMIELDWNGEYLAVLELTPHGSGKMNLQARVAYTFKRVFRFNLLRPEGRLEILRPSIGAINRCEVSIATADVSWEIHNAFRNEVGKDLEAELLARASASLEQFSGALQDIPIDQMTRQMFGERESLSLHAYGLTRDLVVFGYIAAPGDMFFVYPAEFVMGPGQTHQFVTLPLRLASWKVENLAGESGPVGSINGLGQYTAPQDVPGSYLRVKVSATAHGYTSSALVTVLVSEISVNPQVMVHSAGSSRGREMRAGSRSPGDLQWQVVDPGSGARIVPSEDPEGDHTYFPGPVIPNTSFSIDEIRVSSGLSRESAYVLVSHRPSGVIVKAQRIGSGETVQLKGYNGGAEVPAGMRREWKVLLGAGSVDLDAGVFTPGGLSPYRFCIVTLKVWLSEVVQAEGYILLPIPYVELSEIDWTPPRLSADQ